MLSFHTGARISEVVGLTWDDVDLSTGWLSIVRQLSRSGYFGVPKTQTSTRTICLDEHIISALRAWKLHQSKHALLMGRTWQMVYECADGSLYTSPKAEEAKLETT